MIPLSIGATSASFARPFSGTARTRATRQDFSPNFLSPEILSSAAFGVKRTKRSIPAAVVRNGSSTSHKGAGQDLDEQYFHHLQSQQKDYGRKVEPPKRWQTLSDWAKQWFGQLKTYALNRTHFGSIAVDDVEPDQPTQCHCHHDDPKIQLYGQGDQEDQEFNQFTVLGWARINPPAARI